MGFPRKRLKFEQVGVDQELLDECEDLKRFLRGLDDTSPTWLKASGAANKAFVPQMSVLSNTISAVNALDNKHAAASAAGGSHNISNGSTSKNLTKITNFVYKVNVPGWLYRSHFTSAWNSNPEYAVMIAHSDTDVGTNATKLAALNWILLFRTRGDTDYVTSGGAGRNHANNWFPISPASTGFTYLYIKGSAKAFDSGAGERQELIFVPSFGAVTNSGTPLKYLTNKDVLGGATTKRTAAGSDGTCRDTIAQTFS